MRSFATISTSLDRDVRLAFEPSIVNRHEAGRKAAEGNKHLAEAENLTRFGFVEDAQARYEAAMIAAADSLLALAGCRVTNAFRGRAHEVKKHFLVAVLMGESKPTPTLEQALSITHVRHLVEYGASVVEEYLTPRAADEARQAAALARRSTLEILAEAEVVVPELPIQKPHPPR